MIEERDIGAWRLRKLAVASWLRRQVGYRFGLKRRLDLSGGGLLLVQTKTDHLLAHQNLIKATNEYLLAGQNVVKATNELLLSDQEAIRTTNENLLSDQEKIKLANEHLRREQESIKAGNEIKARNEHLLADQNMIEATNDHLLSDQKKIKATNDHLLADQRSIRATNDHLLADQKMIKATNDHLLSDQNKIKLLNEFLQREQEWLKAGNDRLRSGQNEGRALNAPQGKESASGLKMAPGMFSPIDIEAIIMLAKKVRPGGTIVDVGSLLGGSASLWCIHSAAARIVCVDPWKYEPWLESFRDANGPITKEAFLANVPDKRIETIQGYSPACAEGWTDPIDLYWEDGDHNNPACAEGIGFWSRYVRPGGIACGHDYHWPDVKAEADALAARWGSTVNLFGSVWWTRNGSEDPGEP
jgi:hypothetical protein